MKIFDFLKKRDSKIVEPTKRKLEVPAAPPSKHELPKMPSPKEVPELRKADSVPDFGNEFPEIPKKRESSISLKNVEKYAMEKQQEELDEREELKLRKPIFVDLDNYKDMIKEVTMIQNTLKEGEDSLARMGEFKQDEDKEFTKWESEIKDIQRKLIYADKTLFAAQK